MGKILKENGKTILALLVFWAILGLIYYLIVC